MKDKTLLWLLGMEAVLCLVLGLWPSTALWMTQAAGLPFVPLAECLRAMSLAGRFGNGAAMLVYGALSLLPLWYYFRLKNCGDLLPEDWLLPLMCLVLFFVLRWMVNSQEERLLETNMEAVMYGYGFWSLAAAWAVLRFLRLARDNAGGGRGAELFLLAGLRRGCGALAYGSLDPAGGAKASLFGERGALWRADGGCGPRVCGGLHPGAGCHCFVQCLL